MKEFSKLFLKKNLILIGSLYGVASALLVLDGYLLHLKPLATFGRFLWFLPFVLLMLLFCFLAVKSFEKSVKNQEKKYNQELKYERVRTISNSKKIFATDSWLIIAGKCAYHFSEIAEMGDELNYGGLKPGGNCKIAIKLQNGKIIAIQGDNLSALSLLKTAWITHRDSQV